MLFEMSHISHFYSIRIINGQLFTSINHHHGGRGNSMRCMCVVQWHGNPVPLHSSCGTSDMIMKLINEIINWEGGKRTKCSTKNSISAICYRLFIFEISNSISTLISFVFERILRKQSPPISRAKCVLIVAFHSLSFQTFFSRFNQMENE